MRRPPQIGVLQAIIVDGDPRRPRGMSTDAARMWQLVVRAYSDKGVLAELDGPLLQSVCELWALYRLALNEAQTTPTNKVVRSAVLGYWQAWKPAERPVWE